VGFPALIGELLQVISDGYLLRLENSLAVQGVHHNGRKYHLGDCVRQTRNTGRLTEKVAPPNDPRPGRNVFRRYNVFCDIVHSSSSWVCGYQFSDSMVVSEDSMQFPAKLT
jgi:hypothetical protein